MLFTGPTGTIAAWERRLQAWAKSIRSPRFTHVSSDGEARLGVSDMLTDERTVAQLRFDIGVFSVPELPVSVTRSNGNADEVSLIMRSDDAWLRAQASVNVTAPFLTLAGKSELPAHLDDQSPMSAGEARRITADTPGLRRLLTDPASGRVLEAEAKTYKIPLSLKATVAARWVWCTVPGCSRRASATTVDIDHIEPFDHADPAHGGPTKLFNLHPLCRRHHLLKTEGRFRVTTIAGEGMRGTTVRWTFPAAVADDVVPPGSELEVAHAQECVALGRSSAGSPCAGSNHGGVDSSPMRSRVDEWNQKLQQTQHTLLDPWRSSPAKKSSSADNSSAVENPSTGHGGHSVKNSSPANRGEAVKNSSSAENSSPANRGEPGKNSTLEQNEDSGQKADLAREEDWVQKEEPSERMNPEKNTCRAKKEKSPPRGTAPTGAPSLDVWYNSDDDPPPF